MAHIDMMNKTISCKIVYYGPGFAGKTTNLEVIHKKTPPDNRGDLTSITTHEDRTLFFDYMPMELGVIAGLKNLLRLFTVPGQVYYKTTRKIVLRDVDGVIFVADSQKQRLEDNLQSLQDLEENLREYEKNIHEIPLVIQWNKRDMMDIHEIDFLEERINYLGVPSFPATAISGDGIFPTLKKCIALVLQSVRKNIE